MLGRDENPTSVSPIRILFIDDDPLQREVLSLLLGEYDYVVHAACGDFEAMRMVRENQYDLLLIDYHMQDMDGLAVARVGPGS